MTSTETGLPARYDALDPSVIDDPYPTYARLRSAGPLCRMGPGSWGITRHADVAGLLRDPRLSHHFSAEHYQASVGVGPTSDLLQHVMSRFDPPEHTRLRNLIGKAFSPAMVWSLRGHIRQLVDDLLAPARDRGGFDVVSDLALPLTVTVTRTLLSMPTDDWEKLPRASDLGRASAPFFFPDPEGAKAADAAVVWLRGYLDELVRERRRRPGDDLLSRMLAAEQDGDRLRHEEIVDNTVLTFFAGFETSVGLISTACATLLRYPDQLARLRADRTLIRSAVEEVLRYDTGIQSAPRLVRDPITLGGRTIRPGRVLVLMLGSANHDEAVFPEPTRFDVGRQPNPHVAFGGGIHYCLGAALSRLEGAIVIEGLLDHFAGMEEAGPAVRQPSASFRAYQSVPVAVR